MGGEEMQARSFQRRPRFGANKPKARGNFATKGMPSCGGQALRADYLSELKLRPPKKWEGMRADFAPSPYGLG